MPAVPLQVPPNVCFKHVHIPSRLHASPGVASSIQDGYGTLLNCLRICGVVSADEGEDGQMGCEKALQKGLAAMMFVELLFWKNAHDSEEVRDEYHWKVLCCSLKPLGIKFQST